jgi:parvulin-like peptidyl-prolyl isomerase
MAISLEINSEDILTQVKISQMVPSISEKILLMRIIEDEAEQAGIKLAVSELQEAADDFRTRNGLIGVKNTETWLNLNQLSLDEFEAMIRLQLLKRKLQEVVLGDKVESYFYQHQLDFDQVVLSEVVLKSQELATEMYYAVREGELRFHEIVSKYAEDRESKYKGGYLGRIRRKDISSELSSVFSVTNPPQTIKPITMDNGCHLFWIEDLIKAELDQEIREEIQEQLFMEFLREKAATIVSTVKTMNKAEK